MLYFEISYFQTRMSITLVFGLYLTILQDMKINVIVIMSNSRGGGGGCAGCTAAHPIYATFLSKDPSFGPQKLDFYTELHTQYLEASIGPEIDISLYYKTLSLSICLFLFEGFVTQYIC